MEFATISSLELSRPLLPICLCDFVGDDFLLPYSLFFHRQKIAKLSLFYSYLYEKILSSIFLTLATGTQNTMYIRMNNYPLLIFILVYLVWRKPVAKVRTVELGSVVRLSTIHIEKVCVVGPENEGDKCITMQLWKRHIFCHETEKRKQDHPNVC